MKSAAAFILILAGSSASAESLHQELPASELSVDGPCAASVTITADPGLSGKVVLDATASHPEELAQLRFAGSDPAKLERRNSECWPGHGDFTPTMTIALRVPASFPVSIDESGVSNYRLDGVLGPVSVDLSGEVKLQAGQVGPLKVDISGSAETRFDQVKGATDIETSGSATVSIGTLFSPALKIDASGSGRVDVGSGEAGALKIESSGDTAIKLGAAAGPTSVDLSGSGSAVLARVTGPLAQEVSGSGTLQVLSH